MTSDIVDPVSKINRAIIIQVGIDIPVVGLTQHKPVRHTDIYKPECLLYGKFKSCHGIQLQIGEAEFVDNC